MSVNDHMAKSIIRSRPRSDQHATFTIDDLRAAWAILDRAKRTIVCPPDLETQVRELVDAYWLGGLLEVVPNEHCPPDQIFILDTSATDPLSTLGTGSDDTTSNP